MYSSSAASEKKYIVYKMKATTTSMMEAVRSTFHKPNFPGRNKRDFGWEVVGNRRRVQLIFYSSEST